MFKSIRMKQNFEVRYPFCKKINIMAGARNLVRSFQLTKGILGALLNKKIYFCHATPFYIPSFYVNYIFSLFRNKIHVYDQSTYSPPLLTLSCTYISRIILY